MKNFENSEKSVLEEIRQELIDRSGERDIDEESVLKDDLRLDSLDMAELAEFLEKRFNLSVEEADIEKFKTVGDIYNFCRQRLGE